MRIRRIMPILALVMGLAVSTSGTGLALSEAEQATTPENIVISNEISIAWLMAQDFLPDEAEPTRGSLRLSVTWPEDYGALPEYVTAVLFGDGAPLIAPLRGDEGWQADVSLPEGMESPSGSLMDIQTYAIEEAPGEMRFHVRNTSGTKAEASLPEVDIAISASRDGISLLPEEPVYPGDTIHLRGRLENPDALPCALQWECDSGQGWVSIPGANAIEHSFPLTEENQTWQYRLSVAVTLASE